MKTITAYKLSDGSIVECEKEAIETQKKLDFKDELYHLIEMTESYIHSSDLVEFMDENAEELFKILSKRFGSSKKLTIFTSSNEPTKTKSIL